MLKMGHGFEIIKRPGLARFLQEMGKSYELVIFGTEDSQVLIYVKKYQSLLKKYVKN